MVGGTGGEEGEEEGVLGKLCAARATGGEKRDERTFNLPYSWASP